MEHGKIGSGPTPFENVPSNAVAEHRPRVSAAPALPLATGSVHAQRLAITSG